MFGFLLRIKVRRPLNLWTFRLVVASPLDENSVALLGEVKGWAYPQKNGFQLDTIKVKSSAAVGVTHLVWAATMSWVLEETPCRRARLLAIHDDEAKHSSLVRYFRYKGFKTVREVGASPFDLPLRMVWGGAGTLMHAECEEVLLKSCQQWNDFKESSENN